MRSRVKLYLLFVLKVIKLVLVEESMHVIQESWCGANCLTRSMII